MKHLFFLLAFPLLFAGACSESENDPTPEIPADADENFITSVVMTVDGTSYTAGIADNTITMTVPYTVSLDNAEVVFEYTPSATILPDPATLSDWDTERTFRVTSYNGAANDYTYKVVKDEIRHEGDVCLTTAAEVAAFVATDATVIRGDLIIGSEEKNADVLTDISALSILKEVEGNIVIRNGFGGADMTGLDNIVSIGGLQIGSADAFATDAELQMVSMKSLTSIAGDLIVRNNSVAYVQFDNLVSVEGNAIFGSSALLSFEFPALTSVGGDFELQCLTAENEPGGEIVVLEIPELATVGGRLAVNDLGKMTSLRLPCLREAGSIDFASIPVLLDELALPELAIVNGDLNLTSRYISVDAFSSTGNTKLQRIDGLAKLSVVKGTLTISKLQALEELPDWSQLTQLGGLEFSRLFACYNQPLDLSRVDFVPFGDKEPLISISDGALFSKIITQEDMSHVSLYLNPSGLTGSQVGIDPELNFKSIKNFTYSSSLTADPVFLFERVCGNLDINRGVKKGVSAPNLVAVDGYLQFAATMPVTVAFPKLETIGGQFYIKGNLNGTSNFNYDFSSLKTVGCAENPQYAQQGEQSNIPYGSFDVMASNKALSFPALEHVGGVGMTVRAVKSISCPLLQTVDGTLCMANATQFTAFDFPALTRLSGVRFLKLTKIVDFSLFGKFIEEGQIVAENWSVTGCGYNPTFEDMQAGRYTNQ